MKITEPKEQLYLKSTIHYVESESRPGEIYIVILNQGTYFCNCMDFMTRHLPLYGTSAFSLCKHGEFVREHILGPQHDKPKKFGVFSRSGSRGYLARSMDISQTFNTREQAQIAIGNHESAKGKPQYITREVREIE